jgi:hypothetical protein
MRPRTLLSSLLAILMAAAACTAVYDDDGSPDPSSWWSWVCPDGGALAPEAGCYLRDAALDACGDGSVDGGCI